MNKNIIKIVSIATIMTLCLNVLLCFPVSAKTREENKTELYSTRLGITKSVSKRFKRTTLIENRTVEIEYVISGMYVYDPNSGKILSTYGDSLDEVTLVKDPGGANTSWDIEISDISVDSSITSNGAKATFTARFHVNLIRYEGNVPITTYNLGYIQNSVTGTGN
ncbi:hypothetical protein [Clostridium sp. D33t1_170424_F3]|uniref:hypothetical protein n=1 Tax=Clostridium sp. D33t1_170424_F3 TaxID=2787099 RepID=UPI0018A904AD|nr:hypothetical protein [Clostridium sp. D33t1_170424_F3]